MPGCYDNQIDDYDRKEKLLKDFIYVILKEGLHNVRASKVIVKFQGVWPGIHLSMEMSFKCAVRSA